MNPSDNSFLNIFNREVGLKFQLYNSLFTALPFHKVEKTGVLVSIFLLHCEEGFQAGKGPVEIIRTFLEQYTNYPTEQEKIDLLFRFVQYSERQVVLFDALEDAAFPRVNDPNGSGTLNHLHSEIVHRQMHDAIRKKLMDFSVRLVLTAHPTQFYPSEVLVIISDLAKALADDNTALVNSYLQQLGKTPFFKSSKPTPYDEAVNLIWYLENVFYHAAGEIISYLNDKFPGSVENGNRLIKLGFWPGGDRDGNPFVKADTAVKVAGALRSAITRSYYEEVKQLKRRLTFKGVAQILARLEEKLYSNIFLPVGEFNLTTDEITEDLGRIRKMLIEEHNQLFLEQLESLTGKVQLFGLHFASLDIRQDSSIHNALLEKVAAHTDLLPDNYGHLPEQEKMELLTGIDRELDKSILKDEIQQDVIYTIAAIRDIQATNGEAGCHRYIISHTRNALDVIGVYGLFRMSGWAGSELAVDIVPLFESIEDLKNAPGVMEQLYRLEAYRDHLRHRNNIQTIMLGFSDGTKDGGFLMANWSIYKAKEALTAVALSYGIEVVFFDGRGGPPARGGGRTHQFYSSMGSNIANKEIELTIQGQTISANFGTIDTARYNMEQLMHAGIWSDLFASRRPTLTEEEDALFSALAQESYVAYSALKNQPDFLEYLDYASPLRYYSEANIGSRPSRRKKGKLNLDDLRAVPYVGSWSQMKQNLPGYYGVGTALNRLKDEGRWEEVVQMFNHSSFFRTVLENCEMALTKCFFPLTAYLSEHPEYGSLWNMIHDEYQLTRSCLLQLSGNNELMENKPVSSMSIRMRQRIELPLLTIQQYALNRIRKWENESESESESVSGNRSESGIAEKQVYEKLAMRCSFGIINAERNSA
jgi:phosphoenolpyruvate carboxylase